MTYLESLNFKQDGESSQNWLWEDVFCILTKIPHDLYKCGKTKIIRKSNRSFTGDKRENVLYQGTYIFDNEDLDFVCRLFKNIGVLERIKGTKILEKKDSNHRQVLSNLGFTEIGLNIWTKNIFLVSLKPPRFATDRGKCLILKKPNMKNLIKDNRPAMVVYKGRYFFDDIFFTETLLEKIGFYYFFDSKKQKNKTYEFNRETLANSERFIDEEFLKF